MWAQKLHYRHTPDTGSNGRTSSHLRHTTTNCSVTATGNNKREASQWRYSHPVTDWLNPISCYTHTHTHTHTQADVRLSSAVGPDLNFFSGSWTSKNKNTKPGRRTRNNEETEPFLTFLMFMYETKNPYEEKTKVWLKTNVPSFGSWMTSCPSLRVSSLQTIQYFFTVLINSDFNSLIL